MDFYRFLLNDFKSFNPLFKVLFIFPSQYLFAIGFPSVFSFGRSLSPIKAAIQDYPTLRKFAYVRPLPWTGLSPSMASHSWELEKRLPFGALPELTTLLAQILTLSFCLFTRRY